MIHKLNNIIYLNNKHKIGTIEKDELIMYRDSEKHFFRKYNSWCINKEVYALDYVKRFKIIDEKGNHYLINKDIIDKIREKINIFIYYGNEEQLILPFVFWTYIEAGQNFPKNYPVPISEFIETMRFNPIWIHRIILNTEISLD